MNARMYKPDDANTREEDVRPNKNARTFKPDDSNTLEGHNRPPQRDSHAAELGKERPGKLGGVFSENFVVFTLEIAPLWGGKNRQYGTVMGGLAHCWSMKG